MTLMDRFTTFIESDKPHIQLIESPNSNRTFNLMKLTKGTALCVYGMEAKAPNTKTANFHEILHLYAIVQSGIVYLCEPAIAAILPSTNSAAQPAHIQTVYDAVTMLNQKQEKTFEVIYADIPTRELTAMDEQQIGYLLRSRTLNSKQTMPDRNPLAEYTIMISDVLDLLCGSLTVSDRIWALLNDPTIREEWIGIKSRQSKIDEMIASSKQIGQPWVEPWEKTMATAIQPLSREDLTVTFTHDGNAGWGMMSHTRLMKKLIIGHEINVMDFQPKPTQPDRQAGATIFDLLQTMGEKSGGVNVKLYSADIASITHNGTLIYERSRV